LALGLKEARLYARQLALPEVGGAGMERLRRSSVVVFGDDLASCTARLYLEAAGVGRVIAPGIPTDLAGFRDALAGADAAVHLSLDDDGALAAAEAAGVPLLVGRVNEGGVELVSFRRHRSCGHASPAVTQGGPRAARAPEPGAAAVVLATLAANEILFVLLGARDEGPAAQLLRLPLAGGEPARSDLPWPRPCPVCASASSERKPS
jgi:hypothetical protein